MGWRSDGIRSEFAAHAGFAGIRSSISVYMPSCEWIFTSPPKSRIKEITK